MAPEPAVQPLLQRLWAVRRPLALYALPWLLILTSLGLALDAVLVDNLREPMLQAEREKLGRARNIITRRLATTAQDTLYLASLPALQALLDGDPAQKLRVTEQFVHFSAATGKYDQIRWIDEGGMERIRVDLKPDGARAVPDAALQDKSRRPYFSAAMQRAAGELYFSRFDLNVENEVIERPYKPTLRVATPVFSRSGAPRGLVVLNYLGADMLDALALSARMSRASLEMVDDQGYWLLARNPEDAWGFMLDAPQRNYAARNPERWARMQTGEEGYFRDAQGLWGYQRFRVSALAAGAALQPVRLQWFLVGELPVAALRHNELPVRLTILALTLSGMLVAAWSAAWLALSQHERRAALEALQRRSDELASANASLQRALDAQARIRAELVRAERLSSLGLMVAGVAHELNTPLGSALVTLSGLDRSQRDLRGQLEQGLRQSQLQAFLAQQDEGLPLLRMALERAARLVQRFKQLAVDRQTEERRQFALGEVLQDSLHLILKRQTGERQRLVLDVPPGIVLDSYPGPLGQIIDNLVSNAFLHAFPDDQPGRVTVRAELEHDGNWLCIRVSDDGCGIVDEDRERLFDLFYTTRRNSGGTGIGLFLAHQLATEVLGGSLVLEARAVAGSCFLLRIPVVAA